jgi:uncharacterized lipoprotein YmbA
MKSTMQMTSLTIIAALVFLLSGCGRTPPARFYLLQPVAEAGAGLAEPPGGSGPAVGIGPIVFPDYLLRPQIATQRVPHRLDYAEYDRWAESLDDNFVRVFSENLSRLIPTDRIDLYPWHAVAEIEYQVTITVLRFEALSDGTLELVVLWSLVDAEERHQLLRRKSIFSREFSASPEPDYARMAGLMSQLVNDLSREVAGNLRRVMR